ncbi:hypothetical protein [Methanoregula sp.]|uniref:hypothetical protein n=1 Tax=Methanoregula sp. TaxID=2052170 RepID=UPI003BB0E6ED
MDIVDGDSDPRLIKEAINDIAIRATPIRKIRDPPIRFRFLDPFFFSQDSSLSSTRFIIDI